MKSTKKGTSIPRHGTTVLEIVAAGAILGVLIVVCVQMLGRTAVQQRAIGNRRAALQMAANAMERVCALPWDELGPAATEAISAAVVEQGMVHRARMAIVVDEPDATLASKRVRITVTWAEGSDEVERKQQLTAWRYGGASRSAAEGDAAGQSQAPKGER